MSASARIIMRRLFQAVRIWHVARGAESPAHQPIFRHIRLHRAARILQLGIGDARIAERLIRAAVIAAPQAAIEFAGIDLFEMRPAGEASGVSLKLAYKLLAPLGAKVRLQPGDPFSALARSANTLTGQHLVLIGADQDAESMARAWFYVPRLLADNGVVFHGTRDADGREQFEQLSRDELQRRARATQRRAA